MFRVKRNKNGKDQLGSKWTKGWAGTMLWVRHSLLVTEQFGRVGDELRKRRREHSFVKTERTCHAREYICYFSHLLSFLFLSLPFLLVSMFSLVLSAIEFGPICFSRCFRLPAHSVQLSSLPNMSSTFLSPSITFIHLFVQFFFLFSFRLSY